LEVIEDLKMCRLPFNSAGSILEAFYIPYASVP
jgi:hypothetical protein